MGLKSATSVEPQAYIVEWATSHEVAELSADSVQAISLPCLHYHGSSALSAVALTIFCSYGITFSYSKD